MSADLNGEFRGPRLLHDLAVHFAPDLEIGRVANFVPGHEVRPDRCRVLEHLASQPLQGAPLPVSHRHVVDHRVPGDGRGGFLRRGPGRPACR